MIRLKHIRLPPADRLALLLDAEGIRYTREYPFHPSRRFRADFFITGVHNEAIRLLVEVEGGVFQRSRHTSGTGFTRDCEKYAEAQMLGYVVLRVTSRQVDTVALGWIKKLIGVTA